jgi:Zn ribbon nucleic-acid-binding protein
VKYTKLKPCPLCKESDLLVIGGVGDYIEIKCLACEYVKKKYIKYV